MIGKNSIRLNVATICDAVQEYLNKRATGGVSYIVTNMTTTSMSHEFVFEQKSTGEKK